ncbi:uncharacterized protein LOC115889121 [Sitophilus oryzae]|uniref:Uncharacterized protein LOC115889121 n=1 Tax=Sitophilus oryzae TaxID=7048 RepID=A0A6J2YQ55_SITOR|nr:uncharacterized protein LOC115889121 [Sitophilus oryzae]
MKITSIIPGLLLLSLGHARHLIYQDESSALQPIVSQSRRTRICAELCMSGLGGTPCGETCYDLIPTNLPLSAQEQSDGGSGSGGNSTTSTASSGGKKYNATARQDSCSVLCKNGLGYPLCSCNYQSSIIYEPDFVQVCSTFCINYDYQIYGCQSCTLYKQLTSLLVSNSASSDFQEATLNVSSESGSGLTIGWHSWCLDMCSDGNGGAACNCDLLP